MIQYLVGHRRGLQRAGNLRESDDAGNGCPIGRAVAKRKRHDVFVDTASCESQHCFTMSNFRAERVFVMLDSPIPGFDHMKAIDPEKLCWACTMTKSDADHLDLDPLFSFGVAAGDQPWQPRQESKWRPASVGLTSVRGLIAYYDSQITKGERSAGLIASALPPIVETLRQLEAVLEKADTYDRQFCLSVKDLA